MTDVKELIGRLRKQGIGPYADDRDEVIDILHEAASALESLSQELAGRMTDTPIRFWEPFPPGTVPEGWPLQYVAAADYLAAMDEAAITITEWQRQCGTAQIALAACKARCERMGPYLQHTEKCSTWEWDDLFKRDINSGPCDCGLSELIDG